MNNGTPIHYLRLMRLDVALIAMVSYLIGARLSGPLAWADLLVALLVCLVSTNSVYSLNAWADADIDRVNKPRRPVASGLVSPRAALRYATGLLVLACIYPALVSRSWLAFWIFIAIPVLGIVYSLPVFRVRRCAALGVLLTSSGLTLPMLLGYLMGGGGIAGCRAFFIVLFAFILSVVLLKDVEDVAGDAMFGSDNLFARLGDRLLWLCRAGLVITVLLTALLPIRADLQLFLYVSAGMALVLTIVVKPVRILYRWIIWGTMATGFGFFLLLLAK